MKILELFCGTKSVSNAFKAHGHEVYTVDWNKDFNADLTADVGKLSVSDIVELCGGYPDVIWASPDCTTYTVMSLSKHREKMPDGYLRPKTEYAAFCDTVNTHVIHLIRELNPRFWFIENPMGCMRKMPFMEGLPRYTVTYCQYGEERQKPTDIWTNHPEPNFKPACKRGMPCHVPAPRGSATGTQGIKGARDRSRIPSLLCEHIVKICGGWNA